MHIFFHPRSIAVVGASQKNLGYYIILNLLDGFNGPIYPINPNYMEIEGLPCYPSLEAIPHSIDLVIILVRASLVPTVIKACASKGIGQVIIESAGFAETGEQGLILQEKCVSMAKQSGIRIWGPNCMGFVDVREHHYFSFMHPGVREEGLVPGATSLIVQSGMMSAIFLAEVGRRRIGIAKACSIGNRADVDECDILEYLLDDPETKVIALYLESIPRGRHFARLAQKSTKPIVLLKGGRSQAGAQAAISHTHSLSCNSRLLDSVLVMSDVILTDEIYQMMDIANALAIISPINPECRTAILTLSGGAGILACDALDVEGLPLAQLSEQTKKALGKIFPEWMPVANPIDLFAAMNLHGRDVAFARALDAIFNDSNIDVILIHYVAGLDTQNPDLEALRKRAVESGKVVAFWLMGREQGCLQFRREAQKHGVLVHDNISRIAECLYAASRFRIHKARLTSANKKVQTNLAPKDHMEALPFKNQVWDEWQSKQFLAKGKIPIIKEKRVQEINEAWKVAQEFGLPVVLKGLIPGQVHKTEQGLVCLGIHNQNQLAKAFGDIQQKIGCNGRIIIQKQIGPNYELIAGFIRDNQFGPCVMFGLGGVFSELTKDVAFAMAPLDKDIAFKLMDRIKGGDLLKGFRGMAPLKKDVMADILVRLGNLGIAYPQIEQIDINPLIVNKGIPLVVDANVILAM
jgi:acyl-CoA synthetase (NDP forming)